MAEAILEWSEGCTEEGVDGQVPSPAELCSATDAEGKTAVVFAKELVRLRPPLHRPCVTSVCCSLVQDGARLTTHRAVTFSVL